MESSDLLERYIKNNHLTKSKSPDKKKIEHKPLKFNNQNSVSGSIISFNKAPPSTKSTSKSTNKPLQSPPKISNKPPKKPSINLKDLKHSTEISIDGSVTLKNSSIEDISNSESDEDIKNESKDLKNLRNKINELRKQLFAEIRESKELLIGDDNKSQNEIELDIDNNDDFSSSSSEFNEFSNIESINLSTRKFPVQPKQVSLPETNFKNSKKQKDFQIDSIDLKAQNLIEESESSLNDKLVSSDGLSSRSYSSSISSSCCTIINDTNVHKPEFLKYLENKTKAGNEPITGDPLKPEEDILYQWRLRRKLEEAKKNTDQTNSTFIPIKIPHVETKNEKMDVKPAINIPVSNAIKLENEKKTKINLKNSIQTQTSNLVDSEIQTDFEFIKPLINTNENIEKNFETKVPVKIIEYEIPTKDNDVKINIKKTLDKKESQNVKPKFTASSPIKQNKLTQFTEYSNENTSQELTRISAITDKTTNSSTIPKKSKFSNEKRSSLEPQSSSITSTISSICSTLTNVTERNSPIHIQSSSVQIIKKDKQPKKDCLVVKKNDTFSNDNSNDPNMSIYSEEFFNSFDKQDKELFESDDILRILFKKTYFYQLKLKQIDELLTK